MKQGSFLRWGRWFGRGTEVRQPRHGASSSPGVSLGGPVTEETILRDIETLRQVVSGLEELQQRVTHSEVIHAAEHRGYLTPDEDDRVRQGLLAYRNYRLTLYEIILRLEAYPKLRPAGLRLKVFLVAFVAALTLYAKSLRLSELAEQSDVVRAKLNEPEPKFDLDAGFFDEVMAGYCSLRNYGLIVRALWFWGTRRRAIRNLARLEPEPWSWLERLAVTERRAVQFALGRVLRNRLKLGWREFRQTAFKPVDQLQYDVRSEMGGRVADVWLQPKIHQRLDDATLEHLRSWLRPADILLMRSEGKLTTTLLPGFWAHAAIYLGSHDELSALDSERAKEAEGDQGLGFTIDVVSPCVRIVSLKTCLDADHVVVLRPALSTDGSREVLEEALRHFGKAYDFEFDFSHSNRLVCTGLVYRSFHGRDGIRFDLVKRLGNYTLSGDDMVSQSLAPQDKSATGLTPVGLVLRRTDGWQLIEDSRRISTLLKRIQKGWRPIRS